MVAKATSGAEAVEAVTKRGCSQGSVVGPFVWWLMQLEPHCQFSAYADDLLLLVEKRPTAYSEGKGTRIVSLVGDWSSRVDFQVSVDKTVMKLLRGQLSLICPPNIRYGD